MRLNHPGYFRDAERRSADDRSVGRTWPLGSCFARAFTLVEMLVVLAIIGLVIAVSVPAFRPQNEGIAIEAATRQLMQDLQFARQNAIATRSTVAVVFIPRDILVAGFINPSTYSQVHERTNFYRLQGGPLTTYALFGFRQIGEQPGAATPRYITPWRTLPEKTFIAESAFNDLPPSGFYWATNAPFPFPFASSNKRLPLPYIAFNPQGQCLPVANLNGSVDDRYPTDIYIPLASGVVNYTRQTDGDAFSQVLAFNAQEIPPNNSVNSSNVIHIDWLTGRARLERADILK